MPSSTTVTSAAASATGAVVAKYGQVRSAHSYSCDVFAMTNDVVLYSVVEQASLGLLAVRREVRARRLMIITRSVCSVASGGEAVVNSKDFDLMKLRYNGLE